MDKGQKLSEFDLIARFFVGVGYENIAAVDRPGVDLGIGDDCALLSIPPDHQLALSIDTLIAGRHFPKTAPAFDVGQRALAVSVSDLAAMGAKPIAFTLAISLPVVDIAWLEEFSRGLKAAAEFYGIPLVGGDTTQGALSITIQVQGSVAKNRALKRSGAKLGDSIYVSGSLGDGAAALGIIDASLEATQKQKAYLLKRFYRPEVRIDLGRSLIGVANSAIDISDGLLADLKHITSASGVAAEIKRECLPLSEVTSGLVSSKQAIDFALSGGDDYELCFTASEDMHQRIMDLSQKLKVNISKVGRIFKGSGVRCVDEQGQVVKVSRNGYQHFS